MPSASEKRILPAVIILAIFTLLVYRQTTEFDFVWDDARVHLHGNKNLREDHPGEFWKKPYEGLYIPVAYSAWWTVKNIFPSDNQFPKPFSFHLSNVLLHTINVLLVFHLLLLLFSNLPAAFAGALIFSVHPLQAEAVSWISEFRGLLSAAFFLAGLLYFVKRCSSKLLLADYAIIFFSGLLSILSKPSAIVFPVALLIAGFFLAGEKVKSHFIFLSVMMLSLLPFAIITATSQPAELAEMNFPAWMHLVLPGNAIAHYLMKIFFPINLSASYGETPLVIQNSAAGVIISVIVIAAILASILKFRNNNTFISGFGFFIIALLPVSGIVPFYFQQFSNAADRFAYLPMVAVAAFAADAFLKIEKKTGKNVTLFISLFVIVILAAANFKEQKKWKNDITLWNDVVTKNPKQAIAWDNLAVSYLDDGNLNRAIIASDEAIGIDGSRYKSYFHKANALARAKKLDEAIGNFSKAIELNPAYSIAWYNRSLSWYQLNEIQKAKSDFLVADSLGYEVNAEYRRALFRTRIK